MKKAISFILFVSIVLIACKTENKKHSDGEVVKNKYATGFEVSKIDEGYILKTFNRTANADSTINNYLLSSKADAKSTNNNIIQIPVSKVVCLSTTHCAFISNLDEISSIKGISGLDYIYDDKIKEHIISDKVSEVGYGNQINIEKIISLNPDVVFAFGIDNISISSYQKLNEVGIPIVYIGEFYESTPLGRTEWIKLFSCFYDNLDYALEYFDSVEYSYNKIKEDISLNKNQEPEVVLNSPWQGTWWVPGKSSYFTTFISDAGGKYTMVDSKDETQSSIPLSIEEVFANSQNATIWLNPNMANKIKDITKSEPRLKDFKPLENAKIYNNNKRVNKTGGNDFYESGVLHPDLILKDLGIIFNNINSSEELYYYKELY